MCSYRIVSELTINSPKEEREFFYIQKSTSWLKRRLGFYWKFIHYHQDVRHHRPVLMEKQKLTYIRIILSNMVKYLRMVIFIHLDNMFLDFN